ncbi:hypothetical protein BJY04DRAFT_209959 [Aspergillus karnatakaensis]|uniref:bZIP transcription factor n=1 Tax=Aspergillus karnatakaensis TaxID=1810916 RepID=UPI003CCE316D
MSSSRPDQENNAHAPTAEAPPILLSQFSERFTGQPQDDWSGIADRKQRRKVQNRLNQRALRLRRKLDKVNTNTSRLSPEVEEEEEEHSQINQRSHNCKNKNNNMESMTTPSLLAAIGQAHILGPESTRTKHLLHHFETLVYTQYALPSPRTDLLLHLMQFNFMKALVQNMAVLGLSSEQMVEDDAISPFNLSGPWHADRDYHNHRDFDASLPPCLRATIVQRTVPHHPWLDLLPIPQMRDNLILAGESYDELQLCLDMKGHGRVHADQTGIIVWSDPWVAAGWEVTESFARSWGWVLRGCEELGRSTDYWRAQRNERPLFTRRSWQGTW